MVFAVISASPGDWLKMTAAAAFVVGLVLAAWAANRRPSMLSSNAALCGAPPHLLHLGFLQHAFSLLPAVGYGRELFVE